MKVHHERSGLISLLNRTLEDLRECTFSILYTHVMDEKTRSDRVHETQAKFIETTKTKERLEKEVADLQTTQEETLTRLDNQISSLQSKHQALNTEMNEDIPFLRLKEEAHTHTMRTLQVKDEVSLQKEVEELREKIQLEDRVNSKTVEILRNQADKYAGETSSWNSRYEEDTNKMSTDIEDLKLMYDSDLIELKKLLEREAQEAEELEAERLKQEEEERWLALQGRLKEFKQKWGL
ncbi:hypothetical protein GEMRC1_011028 [Eukaryota sp. GEM-RC1]